MSKEITVQFLKDDGSLGYQSVARFDTPVILTGTIDNWLTLNPQGSVRFLNLDTTPQLEPTRLRVVRAINDHLDNFDWRRPTLLNYMVSLTFWAIFFAVLRFFL